MPKRPNLLLAEDDRNLGLLLADYLQTEGFDVQLCPDGEDALRRFGNQTFDLCLLDVMMPKMDGFALAEAIRRISGTTPFLFLTAKSFKADKLKGYGLGADDYITKPFDEEELLWKIKAIIRRAQEKQVASDKILTIGKYTFSPVNQLLMIGEKAKRVTEKESEILLYLYTRRNRVIHREEMLTDLWGKNDYFLGRSLDVFITKIRKYLKEDPALRVENVFGVGFVFNVPE